MAAFTSKVCILGDFAVGKTSTAERFVNNQFSDKYLTTIGVKVDTKELELEAGVTLKLVLWDVAGADRFGELELNYLRGASGHLLVADGTRPETIGAARTLREQAIERYGEVPFVFLLNKADLTDAWDVADSGIAAIREEVGDVFLTSAKTGENVAEAIETLGRLIAEREFGSS